jgi:hypothetical protein
MGSDRYYVGCCMRVGRMGEVWQAMDSGGGAFIGRSGQMFPTMVKRHEGCIDAICGWKEE